MKSPIKFKRLSEMSKIELTFWIPFFLHQIIFVIIILFLRDIPIGGKAWEAFCASLPQNELSFYTMARKVVLGVEVFLLMIAGYGILAFRVDAWEIDKERCIKMYMIWGLLNAVIMLPYQVLEHLLPTQYLWMLVLGVELGLFYDAAALVYYYRCFLKDPYYMQ